MEEPPLDLRFDSPLTGWVLDACVEAAIGHHWPLKNRKDKVVAKPGVTMLKFLNQFEIPD